VAGREPLESWVAPTFGQRLGGRVLDGLVYLVPWIVLAQVLSGVALVVVGYSLIAVYEVLGVLVYGRTLGKQMVGTRVVNIDPTPIEPWQAFARFAVYGLPAWALTAVGVPLGADIWVLIVVLPILRPPLHRGIHDFAARTIVVPTKDRRIPPDAFRDAP
jgi:uncharacterized RDD family membrane protein YckC